MFGLEYDLWPYAFVPGCRVDVVVAKTWRQSYNETI